MDFSFLQKFSGPLKLLTPPTVALPTEDYDGYQLRYKNIVFRPGQFQIEGGILSVILLYVVAWFIGKSINSRRAKAWFKAVTPFYETQFTRPDVDGLIADGCSDFFIFSTGRRGVQALHTIFTLLPRHDMVQTLYSFGRGLAELDYSPKDNLELDFTLSPSSVPGFVWAVVKKDEMRDLRRNRWDVTFTKTTENASLPPFLSVMSEAADVTDSLLKGSLSALLNDPVSLKYFRYLIITDQPSDRPDEPVPAIKRERHLILSLLPPPSSKAAETLRMVEGVFDLVDILDGKLSLKPETIRKMKKIRVDVDEELSQEAVKARKEQEAEAIDEKKLAKKRAEEERVSKLSPAEQKKWEEKERKRSMKKSQPKMVKR